MQLKNGKIGSIYPLIRRLAKGPNDVKNKAFDLPHHVENDFTPAQCAEDILSFFTAISQEYHSIDINLFSPNLRSFLDNQIKSQIPVITEVQVYNKLKSAKKCKSSVEGDLHPKLISLLKG